MISPPSSVPPLDPPDIGQRVEIRSGLWWVRMPLPFALDHINLWLIEGDSGYTIVDAGIATDAVRSAWEVVLSGLDKPVSDILVTHFHPDHLGLASWLAATTGAPVHMSAAEYLSAHLVRTEQGGHGVADMLRFYSRHGLEESVRRAAVARGNTYRIRVPDLPNEYRRLRGGDTIELGGNTWHQVAGFGHSPEHIALHSPTLAVLISGDMLLPRITTNISVYAMAPEEDQLSRYLSSLAAWKSLPDDTLVLPSHGMPFFGARPRIEAIEAHHAVRLRALEDACAVPMAAAEVLPTLFVRPLDLHQTMFAMGETIAHLSHLAKAGRLDRTCDADHVLRFRRRVGSA